MACAEARPAGAQMRGMRDQTNAAVAAHKAAQAQVAKLEGQAAHWQNLWRSAAAGNAKLQQRVALLQDALAHGAAPPPAVAAPPPALPAISVRPRPRALRWPEPCAACGHSQMTREMRVRACASFAHVQERPGSVAAACPPARVQKHARLLRRAARAQTVRFELEPGLPSPGALGGDLLADALLEDVGGLSETPTGMGRSHSAALPASPFSGLAPVTSGGRRAASAARGPLDLAPVFAGAAPPFASSVSAPAPSPLGAASPAGARPPRAPPAAAPKSDPDTMDELRPFADGPYDAFFAGL